jgi:hypothetical protein
MIKLEQNTTNRTILTLSESVTYTGSPVYFLFRFYNLTTHQEKLFTASDVSTNIVRYNEFNITLTGSSYENLSGGTISLQPDGELYYEVYEQLSPTNLALSGTSGTILEKGMVQVKGTDLNIINVSYSGTPNTYIGYEG